MKLGAYDIPAPLFLGPMAGVTDWAFRTVCAEQGANVTVTEMVSSRALVYQDKKSAALLRKNEGSVCGAQIFGNDPQIGGHEDESNSKRDREKDRVTDPVQDVAVL